MREGPENWPRANKSSCSFKIMYLKAMFNIPWGLLHILALGIYSARVDLSFRNISQSLIYIYILHLSISILI